VLFSFHIRRAGSSLVESYLKSTRELRSRRLGPCGRHPGPVESGRLGEGRNCIVAFNFLPRWQVLLKICARASRTYVTELVITRTQ